MKKFHDPLAFIWIHINGLPIRQQVIFGGAIAFAAAFAVVGAVHTAYIWLPVLLILAIAVVCLYLLRHFINKQWYKKMAEIGIGVRKRIADIVYVTLNRTADFPIAICRHYDIDIAYNACTSHWLGKALITRVQLEAARRNLDVTGEDCYLMQMFLQHLTDIYCKQQGLIPPSGEHSCFVITHVEAIGLHIFVDYVQTDTPANREYIKACMSPRPVNAVPPCNTNPYLRQWLDEEEEMTVDELMKDLMDDDIL